MYSVTIDFRETLCSALPDSYILTNIDSVQTNSSTIFTELPSKTFLFNNRLIELHIGSTDWTVYSQ